MKKWIKGSYTVEAALLLPFILLIIVSFVYLSFYLHDKYRIEEVLNMGTLKAIEYNQTETHMVTGLINYESYIKQGIFYRFQSREEKEVEVYNFLDTYLNERLFLTRINEIDVYLSDTDVEIKARAYVDFPILGGIIADDYTIIFYIKEENIISTREFVRMFDVFGGVIEQVPGADEIINMLKKVLETVR